MTLLCTGACPDKLPCTAKAWHGTQETLNTYTLDVTCPQDDRALLNPAI